MRRKLLKAVKWLMTSAYFLLALGVFLAGVSFIASELTGQWHWFQRSGALLVSIGVILSTRRLLRIGLDGLILESSYFELAANLDLSQGDKTDLETGRDLRSAYLGFVVVGIGTLVWAYGDLLGYLLG